jgi:hypothetical protein
MIKRLSVVLLLSLFVVFTFAGGAFSATSQKAKTSLKVSDLPSSVADMTPPAAYKYAPSGGNGYKANCLGITPENGVVVEHAQIGDTWYDFQKNGAIGRMISVTSGGYRHISWMYTNCVYGNAGCYRYVKGACEDPSFINNWPTAQNVDGGANINAGYSNQTHLSDGTALVIYHRTAGSPTWNAAITVDDEPCGGYWTRHYDIPDGLPEATSASKYIEWPKCEVQHDNITGRDYIHVVGTEANTAGGEPVMVGYERCWIKDSTGLTDPMYCQCYRGGATVTNRMLPGVNGAGISFAFVSQFDSSCSITPIVAVSKISKKVAIAFLKPADPAGSCSYYDDVCFIESMNLGDEWVDGTLWPPPEYNITHYGISSGERAWEDLSVCYDYQDSLHIIWSACKFDSTDQSLYPGQVKLKHWSKKAGISTIAIQTQEAAATISGAHSAFIAKMSISASDPIYHPGGSPDSVYLWTIWTQFDSSDLEANGANGNGDLYGCGSNDGGSTWGGKYNLTNTQTPGCTYGNCLSEHWSSLSQNMWNGDLHIDYICDQDAGGAVQDGTQWMANPVMYLRMHEWDLSAVSSISISIISPASWYKPPLKVAPNGNRTLIYRVYSNGNKNLVYSVSTDNPSCISASGGGALAPRDSATLTATISGSGACNNTFISGNIIFTSDDPQYPTLSYPVQAVVSDSFYECPRDMATNDTLKNGVMNFYITANSQEWAHDTSATLDTTYEVFFQGGPFVATKEAGDTLVGRYYGTNDAHTMARVDLRQSSFTDYWLEYSWDVAIHDLNPPTVDTKWWWFDILHENVFFKSTANADLKYTIIKFVTAERHNAPGWWPTHPAYTGYEDTYLGMMMDIDCPYDTFAGQSGRNRAGYDATNNIAWQRGWDFTGAHTSYNDYYAGMALAAGTQPGESVVPWGTYNLRNDSTLYPQSPWGWLDGDFYRKASGNTVGYVYMPDSIVDRSQIVTARKIPAGNATNLTTSFTIIEAIGHTGLSDLQVKVEAAREWIEDHPRLLCGDLTGDGVIDAGDVVSMIGYLYRSQTAPQPLNRADVTSNFVVDAGDVVFLIGYLYRSGPAPLCPGIW